jgi:hypothetical protein
MWKEVIGKSGFFCKWLQHLSALPRPKIAGIDGALLFRGRGAGDNVQKSRCKLQILESA